MPRKIELVKAGSNGELQFELRGERVGDVFTSYHRGEQNVRQLYIERTIAEGERNRALGLLVGAFSSEQRA